MNRFTSLPQCDAGNLKKIQQIIEGYYAEERKKFANNPAMMIKLDGHLDVVARSAVWLYPSDDIAYVVALAHDIGRGVEFERTGSFVGRGNNDHHVIGLEVFDSLMRENGLDGTDEANLVGLCIRYHGLDRSMVNGNFDIRPELAHYDTPTRNLIRAISVVDEIANATRAPEYLFREQQEHAKAESKGGWVPDGDKWSREITPEVTEAYRKGKPFSRNEVCRTYPDYNLFWATVAIKFLKKDWTSELTIRLLEEPGYVGVRDKTGTTQSVNQPSWVDAYKMVFTRSMRLNDALEKSKLLEDSVKEAKERLQERQRSANLPITDFSHLV